jgi:TonB family protein
MSEKWKRFEGRTVDGRFPLQNYLGGSDHSAVFLTSVAAPRDDSGKAAIKLVAVSPADAEKQFANWTAARDLNHPNVIRIFESGRCEVDGTKLLYVVEEYAEENLAQILPDRALTAEETRGMLPPVLSALQSVYAAGFVQGSIRPSNIFAIGDQIKLSSDTLCKAGEKVATAKATGSYTPPEIATATLLASTSTDIWQLGMTLVEVLTQCLPVWDRARSTAPEVPTSIPEPFRGIAQNCLQIDPAKRPKVAQITDWLEAGRAPAITAVTATSSRDAQPVVPSKTPTRAPISTPKIPSPQKPSSRWPYFFGLAAIGLIAIYLVARPKPAGSPAEAQPTQDSQTTTRPDASKNLALTSESPVAAVAEGAVKDAKAPSQPNASSTGVQGDVVKRVIPEVSQAARRTIHGKIQVKIKVNVDAAGNVTKTKLESGHGSKYFSRIAMEAARDWKFAPAAAGDTGDRERKLQFGFSRSGTDASVVRSRR